MSRLKPKLFSTMKHYSKDQLIKDVTAGVIVAIIALPLSIALAIASGVSPEKGLHTAIIAGFLISFLGGSRVQIGGPTGAFMVIVYGIVAEYGIQGLTAATIMAGFIMVLMGLFRMGSMVKFIPYPITTGFTSGIALVIFSSQIKDLFGLRMETVPVEFIGKWQAYYDNLNTMDGQTAFIGLLALAILIFWPLVNRKIPGSLVALIVTTALAAGLHLEVATIGSKFGELSSSLPSFSFPNFDWKQINNLLGPAFTIAILGSVESLLSAVVSDGMIGGKHRSNMELIAQGVANMASGLFGGIPATGAIARTVANIKNGGRTPVAGIVHALTLLVIMLVFMPLAQRVPLASLAAILIMVAYNMSEWREFTALFKSPKSDVLVLLVTFFITVFIDLVRAIEVGMVLASLLFMKRMSDVTQVSELRMDASEEKDDEIFDFNMESQRLATREEIQIYEINGPFFFGAADKFVEAMGNIGNPTRVVVLRMRNVPSMDATALHAFRRLIALCRRKKIKLMISGVNEQPRSVMEKSGILAEIGRERFFNTVEEAIVKADELWLGSAKEPA